MSVAAGRVRAVHQQGNPVFSTLELRLYSDYKAPHGVMLTVASTCFYPNGLFIAHQLCRFCSQLAEASHRDLVKI